MHHSIIVKVPNTTARKIIIGQVVSSLLRSRSIAMQACDLVYVRNLDSVVYQDSHLRQKMARLVDKNCMRDPGLALAKKIDRPYGIVANRTIVDVASIPSIINRAGFFFFPQNPQDDTPVNLSFLARPLSQGAPRRLAVNTFSGTLRPAGNDAIDQWWRCSGGDPFAGAATMAMLFQLYVTESITDVKLVDPEMSSLLPQQIIPCPASLHRNILGAVSKTVDNIHAYFAKNDDGTTPTLPSDYDVVAAVATVESADSLSKALATKEASDMERAFLPAMETIRHYPPLLPVFQTVFPPYFVAKDDSGRFYESHTARFNLSAWLTTQTLYTEQDLTKARGGLYISDPAKSELVKKHESIYAWAQIARETASVLQYVPDKYLAELPDYCANVEKGCTRIYRFMNSTRGIMTMKLLESLV